MIMGKSNAVCTPEINNRPRTSIQDIGGTQIRGQCKGKKKQRQQCELSTELIRNKMPWPRVPQKAHLLAEVVNVEK